MGWNDLAQEFILQIEQGRLVVFREAVRLLEQVDHLGPAAQRWTAPRQVKPDLQVTQIVRLESRERFTIIATDSPLASLVEQGGVTRIGGDQGAIRNAEEKIEHRKTLVVDEVTRRPAGKLERRVDGAPLDVIIELIQERRHQIDRKMKSCELPGQRRHIVVVLQPVQTNPGQGVPAISRVSVERLVLMPEERDSERDHARSIWTPPERVNIMKAAVRNDAGMYDESQGG